ncbi:hypothetical protein [Paraburkholderia acidiphila]|uniref:Uncharacterized protein n=1 Tax=Paraburkholderia acidiphila TaxID=2571747 RepID=A0A7Z2JBG8_9BURK|nr:hypothetical protein [Paraburkholderia acidiphila]QGZ56855.1 hypothetical protein FAZ97_18025 [Paraburkholderia acidiphila]
MDITLPSPNETAESLIQSGLRYAVALLDALTSRNSDYLNPRVNVGTFLSWLQEDHPGWAAELAESNYSKLFARRLGRTLFLAQRRDQLEQSFADTTGARLSGDSDAMERMTAVRAAVRHVLPYWSSEAVEDVLDDASALLVSTVPLSHGQAITRAPSVQRYIVNELSPALKAVRRQATTARPDTCFLVPRNHAPQPLQEYIHEKIAVVVPLVASFDESWIFHCQDGRPTYRELIIDDGDGPLSMSVMFGLERGRVFFDYEALRDPLFRRLRAELPVMYVSSGATVLATHPFQPFAFEDAFYAEVTNFQMGWENDTGNNMPFQQRVDCLRRDRLPRHVYVNRFVDDLTGSPASVHTAPALRHWALPDHEQLTK